MKLMDVTAAAVALTLTLGVVLLAFLERPVPLEMATALGSAISWLFLRSAEAANGKSHTL